MDFNIFDSYNLRARVSVIIFYIAPFLIDINFIVGKQFSVSENIIITVITVVICQCLLNICRPKCGSTKRNYAALFLMPNSKLSKEVRTRYYRKIATFEPEFRDFDISEEKWSDNISYELCESVISWLCAKTRDKKTFHLVYEENINYGYYRNMWNLKILGIIFNSIALVIIILQICFPFVEAFKQGNSTTIISMLLHLSEILFLCFGITKNSIKVSAKRYAKALIETIDII